MVTKEECILCGRNDFVLVFSKTSLRIFRCRFCGLTKTSGKIKQDLSYHRDPDYKACEKYFENIFLKRFEIIKRFIKEGRILDVGCSTGTFLELFKRGGWEAWGVEPSKSASLAKRRGLSVINTTFEKANLKNAYFDLIIMNHTLEHMENPLLVLSKANKLLKKGGLIFIDVPNFGSLSSKLLKKNWPYLLPEEHKFHFTKETLTKLLEKAGFKVIYQRSRSGIFEFASPIKEIFVSLTSFKKRFLRHIFFFPMDALATLIGKGDSFSTLAKKV